MDGFAAEIRKIPPVTRFLCASSLGVTIPVIMNLLSPYKIVYMYGLVFHKLQIWRLFTSFFLGSGGIGYIFEFATLYRTADQIESGPYARASADLAWQLTASAISIIILSIPVNSYVFFRPFLLCLVYVWSKLAPVGSLTSIMGLVTLPIWYMPYIFLGIDILIGGPGYAAKSLPGAVVGHLWWWGVWGSAVGGRGGILQEFGRAPQWLRDMLDEGPTPPANTGPAGGAGANQGGGVHIIPPRRTVASASRSDGNTSSGYNWGSGQRLGSG